MGTMIVRAEPTTSTARQAMVDNQIRTFDVTDQRVLETFTVIPREAFLPKALADLAYSDAVLTVDGSGGARRALLVPMVLARMVQGLTLTEADRVLVIAAGTGYAAALVADLCDSVVALECDAGFVEACAAQALALRLPKLQAVLGPLHEGSASNAPYTAMLICGSVERDLAPLLAQLAPTGGRLVAIQSADHEATRRSGKVVRYERVGGEISSRVLFDASAPVLEDFRLEPAFVF